MSEELNEALGFNPHPSRRTGATRATQVVRRAFACFNPHPSRRTGATTRRLSAPLRHHVSILTRPEGRVQRYALIIRMVGNLQFQSSPVPKDGCNLIIPSSAPTCLRVSILTRPEGRVQHGCVLHHGRGNWVSILTRPEGRVQPLRHTTSNHPHVVSILTRPEGRVQRKHC